MKIDEQVREPIAAGSFYPADSNKLKVQIEEYIHDSKDFGLTGIKALICPHAGYIYSGQVAAASYRQVYGKSYDSIIIIAPSHSEYFENVSIYPGVSYRTPLGTVEIDKQLAGELIQNDEYIQYSLYGHRNEHSLEVQLPFIQVALKGIKIVPLVIGKQSSTILSSVGDTLGRVLRDRNALIVASTDLSHYHPYELAVETDKKVIDLIERYDLDGLMEDFFSEELEMCGGGPVITAMIASQMLGAKQSKILEYKNSGDVSGDRSAVVGYLSAALY